MTAKKQDAVALLNLAGQVIKKGWAAWLPK